MINRSLLQILQCLQQCRKQR